MRYQYQTISLYDLFNHHQELNAKFDIYYQKSQYVKPEDYITLKTELDLFWHHPQHQDLLIPGTLAFHEERVICQHAKVLLDELESYLNGLIHELGIVIGDDLLTIALARRSGRLKIVDSEAISVDDDPLSRLVFWLNLFRDEQHRHPIAGMNIHLRSTLLLEKYPNLVKRLIQYVMSNNKLIAENVEQLWSKGFMVSLSPDASHVLDLHIANLGAVFIDVVAFARRAP